MSDSYTAFSDDGVKAVVDNLPDEFHMELNRTDRDGLMYILVEDVKFNYVNHMWSSSFIDAIYRGAYGAPAYEKIQLKLNRDNMVNMIHILLGHWDRSGIFTEWVEGFLSTIAESVGVEWV